MGNQSKQEVEILITRLINDFIRRRREGEAVSVEEYVARYPQHASEIREAFEEELDAEQLFAPLRERREEALAELGLTETIAALKSQRKKAAFQSWWAERPLKEWLKRARQQEQRATEAVAGIRRWLEQAADDLAAAMSGQSPNLAGVRVRGGIVGTLAIRTRGAVRTRGGGAGGNLEKTPPEVEAKITDLRIDDEGRLTLQLQLPPEIAKQAAGSPVKVFLTVAEKRLELGEVTPEKDVIELHLQL